VPATRPLANFSATRDGDIGPNSRNAAHTLFDHRVQPSARSTSWELKIAAHGRIVDRGAIGDPSQCHRRDTCVQGWRARGFHDRRRTLRFFSSVRERWKVSRATGRG
jgi:hypothetical protein